MKPPEEWLKQADYDFVTAQTLYETGRYIYYAEVPPKAHSLVYFLNGRIHQRTDKNHNK